MALRNDVDAFGASPSSSANTAAACCIVSASKIKFSIAPANRSVAALLSAMATTSSIYTARLSTPKTRTNSLSLPLLPTREKEIPGETLHSLAVDLFGSRENGALKGRARARIQDPIETPRRELQIAGNKVELQPAADCSAAARRGEVRGSTPPPPCAGSKVREVAGGDGGAGAEANAKCGAIRLRRGPQQVTKAPEKHVLIIGTPASVGSVSCPRKLRTASLVACSCAVHFVTSIYGCRFLTLE